MTIAAQCHACIKIFKSIASCDTNLKKLADAKLQDAVKDELDRFSLWIGNIGALHLPGSPLSLEKRLEDGQDLLKHASSLLEDLEEVLTERECFESCNVVPTLMLIPDSSGTCFWTLRRPRRARGAASRR